MKTTLTAIRANSPCPDGWKKLLTHLGKSAADDEPLHVREILDSNGLDDALWCLRAVNGHQREMRLYAVWCARQVKHLMTDARSINALDVSERYANELATDDELAAAWDAARAASAPTWDAAWDAARAASAAARAATWDAAWDARDAAWGAAWCAAGCAASAVRAVRAARAVWAVRAKQEAELRCVLDCIDAGADPYPVGTAHCIKEQS